MTKSEKEKYELIEKFIEKNLSREEQEKFDFHLKTDMDFAKEVKAHSEVHELIMDEGIIRMKRKLREIHIAETKGKNNNTNKIISTIATLCLVAGLVTYFYKSQESSVINQENKENKVTVVENKIDTIDNYITKNKEEIHSTSTDKTKEKIKVSNSDTNNHTGDDPKNIQKPISDSIDYNNPTIAAKIDATTNPLTTSSKEKNNPKIIDCSSIQITGEVTVSEACKDEANGRIIIHLNSIKGGTQPIKFSIAANTDFITGSIFENLSEGNYRIYAKDANGCSNLVKEIKVGSKDCPKDHLFYPDYGQEWQLPLKNNSNATVKIFNRAGSLVYFVNITNGYPNTWNGTDNSGQGLPMGNYSFIITYEDQSTTQGNVLIAK